MKVNSNYSFENFHMQPIDLVTCDMAADFDCGRPRL